MSHSLTDNLKARDASASKNSCAHWSKSSKFPQSAKSLSTPYIAVWCAYCIQFGHLLKHSYQDTNTNCILSKRNEIKMFWKEAVYRYIYHLQYWLCQCCTKLKFGFHSHLYLFGSIWNHSLGWKDFYVKSGESISISNGHEWFQAISTWSQLDKIFFSICKMAHFRFFKLLLKLKNLNIHI